jgi:hypothetical protein
VEAWGDALGEDAGGEFAGGAPGDGTLEDQLDAVGATQIEVFADDFLKELAAMDGAVEDLGEGEFHLPDGEVRGIGADLDEALAELGCSSRIALIVGRGLGGVFMV